MIDRRGLVLGISAFSALSLLDGCGGSEASLSLDALRAKAQRGDLKVGFIPYYEIATDRGEAAPPTGFLSDVFGLFAKLANIPIDGVRWRQMTWDSFAPLVQSGGVDLSIAGTFITPARAQRVAFTRPLFALGNGAAVKAGDARFARVRDVLELDRSDLRIAVVSGEQSAEFAQAHFKRAKVTPLDGPDLAAAPRAVEEGRADVAMSDQFILGRYIKQTHDLVDILRDRPFSVLPIAWALRQGTPSALADINNVLSTLLRSSAYSELKKQYPIIPFAPMQ